jgi:hypothetical protein
MVVVMGAVVAVAAGTCACLLQPWLLLHQLR